MTGLGDSMIRYIGELPCSNSVSVRFNPWNMLGVTDQAMPHPGMPRLEVNMHR